MLPWQLKLHHKKPNLNFAIIISFVFHLILIIVPFLIFQNSKIINVTNVNINRLSKVPVIFSNKASARITAGSSGTKKNSKNLIEKNQKLKDKTFKTTLLEDKKKQTKIKPEKKAVNSTDVKKKIEIEKKTITQIDTKIPTKIIEEQKEPEPVVDLKKIEEEPIVGLDEVIDLQVEEGQIDAIQLAVINAVLENWQKPIGFSKDLCCKFKIKISNSGRVEEFLIEELTGIPVYDSEARASLVRTSFPRLTWGMELTIKL